MSGPIDAKGLLGGDGWSLSAGDTESAANSHYRGDSIDEKIFKATNKRTTDRSKTFITGSQTNGIDPKWLIGGAAIVGLGFVAVLFKRA